MSAKTSEPVLAGTSGGSPARTAEPASARSTRAANWALYWTVAFIALHAYWYLGGRVGFGDQVDPLPGTPSSLGDWIFSLVVFGMFAAGVVVPSALARLWGRRLPRRLLIRLMWIGCIVLVARGGSALLDDGLRFTGLLDSGLTGLSNKDALGSAHPSAYTILSTVAIDSIFLSGGLLFGHAARLARDPRDRGSLPTLIWTGVTTLLAALVRVSFQVCSYGRHVTQKRSISLPLLARLTVAWGVLFAVVHFYWAAGGTALGNGGETEAAAQAYIGFIAVVGLVGAAVGHGFEHDWGARLGRQRLTLLARAGGAALALGVLVGVGRWLGEGGVGDDGVNGVVITAYFLLGAVLFSTLGWPRGPMSDPAAAGHV